MKDTEKHIYLVPGLAASPKIFKFLKFPDHYRIHLLEWLIPTSANETIEQYAKRMAALVDKDHAILVGVSFGGVIVQEMSRYLNVEKLILVSSIKSRTELPNRLKVLQKTKAYKLFPSSKLTEIEEFVIYIFGDQAKKRAEIYNKYLSVRSPEYLNWAIHTVLHWNGEPVNVPMLHIHGTDDRMFPIKNIQNCVGIKGGTHVMIINKAKTIRDLIIRALE